MSAFGNPPPPSGGQGVPEQEILARMLEHLRRELPEILPDPGLLDPAVRLILLALARELAATDQQIRGTREIALHSLVRRLLLVPRGPRPAQTVVRYFVRDAGCDVDHRIAVQETVTRHQPDGTPFDLKLEFRPRLSARLGQYSIPVLAWIDVCQTENLLVEIQPSKPDQEPVFLPRKVVPRSERPYLLFCMEAREPVLQAPLHPVFLDGDDGLVRAALWGRWCSATGRWPEALTPGWNIPLLRGRDDADPLASFESASGGWGMFADRFLPLPLPKSPDEEIPAVLGDLKDLLPTPRGGRWWWKVDPAGNPARDFTGLRFVPDCLPVENREFRRFKGTVTKDSLPQGIPLPVAFSDFAGIESVLDGGQGLEFEDADDPRNSEAPYKFKIRWDEAGSQLMVHIEMPLQAARTTRPEILFALNFGDQGNEIGRGALRLLSQPHPAVIGTVSLVKTQGGKPAEHWLGTEEEGMRRALRHRGRAVAAQDYSDLAMAFGTPYVERVTSGPGLAVTPRGVRRCVEVRVVPKPDAFVSPEEKEAVRRELETHLAARAPVGSHVAVRILEGADLP